jgi:hypothetical protein
VTRWCYILLGQELCHDYVLRIESTLAERLTPYRESLAPGKRGPPAEDPGVAQYTSFER